ncbi:hypothetical protein [Microbacterium indicum]|uniref:hypothetical protein n=1 Tax=Microbacterium indicum TaxID=358100 RepID=UPI00040D51FC|nr:hypothetical protein [Microbacterium indicum]
MSVAVTSGSVVAVDPDSLRGAARVLRPAVSDAMSAGAASARQDGWVAEAQPEASAGWLPLSYGGAARAYALRDGIAELVAGLAHAADAYELVELETTRLMGGGSAADAARWDEIAARDPEAAAEASRLLGAWRVFGGAELAPHWRDVAGVDAGIWFLASLRTVRWAASLGKGSLGAGAREDAWLRAHPDRVRMEMTPTTFASRPASSAADAIRRIPTGEGGGGDEPGSRPQDRVRVDRITMADGSERFAVYVSGSRESPLDTSDVLSWKNNLALWTSEGDAPGYEFVVDALHRAGATSASPVDAYGFSQGAMIAQRLARDDAFAVDRVTTIGAPSRIPAPDGTTSLTFAYDDDPVAGLSDGGSPAPLGGPGSALVRGVHDPANRGILELDASAHRVAAYADLAEEFAASHDELADEAQAFYDGLAGAVSVESTVFEAPEYDPESTEILAPGDGPPALWATAASSPEA